MEVDREEFFKDVSALGDDHRAIIRLLDKHGYHDASERDKHWFVVDLYLRQGKEFRSPLIEQIIKADKVDCLKALLPLMPLHEVYVDIPPLMTWIKSLTWMQHLLHVNKARWNPQGCECPDHYYYARTPDATIMPCILTQLAFTSLAAKLFAVGCRTNSMKCLLHLLEIAPMLVKKKVWEPKAENALLYAFSGGQRAEFMPMADTIRTYTSSLPLDEALLYGSAIAGTLIERGLLKQNAGRTLEYLYKNTTSTSYLAKAVDILSKYKAQEIKLYRDVDGNTVLHQVFSLYPLNFYDSDRSLYEYRKIFPFLKQLLRIGLNPTEKNHADLSVLDMMIENYLTWINQNCIPSMSENGKDFHLSIAACFEDCLHLMLLKFLDGVSDFQLLEIPKLNFDEVSCILCSHQHV